MIGSFLTISHINKVEQTLIDTKSIHPDTQISGLVDDATKREFGGQTSQVDVNIDNYVKISVIIKLGSSIILDL